MTATKRAALDEAREAFARQAWGDASAKLLAADRESPLGPEDLERLAASTRLVGREAESADAWARAHQEFLAQGDAPRAARCAFWLAFQLLLKGDRARGSGWLSRARRVLDDAAAPKDCVEQGYLLFAGAFQAAGEGDVAAAASGFRDALACGERFSDPQLVAMARLGHGRAFLRLGEIERGVALLDEVMVAVTAGEVPPFIAGGIYCSVIDACHDIFDLRRAQEWTAALNEWCGSRPDVVAHRGECLVHRAEILRLHGSWAEALEEAERAREHLSQPPVQRGVGGAFYELGDLHRLRGEFAKAEDAYRRASESGRDAQPGLALLRMAQGRLADANSAICRAAEETQARPARARLLAACVEIAVAAGDVAAARASSSALGAIAAGLDAPFLRAVSSQAQGEVLLAEGDPKGALAALRVASAAWAELDAPYEAARVRVLVGLACRALGDADSAALEIDAARQVFHRLGAAPDLARLDALSAGAQKGAATPLTEREVEVLCLVATGRTNRAIAKQLSISEKTVARHVSNIFTKLGLPSRSAATAYAYENGLMVARS